MHFSIVLRVVLAWTIAFGAASRAAAQSTLSYNAVFDGTSITGTGFDAAGNLYLAGSTTNANLPITPGAFQKAFVQSVCGTVGNQPIPCPHAYIAKIDPTGTRLLYATYLGGSFEENPSAMTVDPDGAVYLTGLTTSKDFPTTPSSYKTTPGPGFVTKLTPDGSSVVFSTYLPVVPTAIALDPARNVFITGSTSYG